jgi:hypothetical protein
VVTSSRPTARLHRVILCRAGEERRAPRASWLALYVWCVRVLVIVLDQSVVTVADRVTSFYLLTYGASCCCAGGCDVRGNRRSLAPGTIVVIYGPVDDLTEVGHPTCLRPESMGWVGRSC